MDTAKLIRTQISLTQDQKATVDQISRYRQKSMAEVLREALVDYILKYAASVTDRKNLIYNLAGSWNKAYAKIDSVKWQRQLRREKRV